MPLPVDASQIPCAGELELHIDDNRIAGRRCFLERSGSRSSHLTRFGASYFVVGKNQRGVREPLRYILATLKCRGPAEF
jgi:hypothetical protein